jgi:hypothetical protein
MAEFDWLGSLIGAGLGAAGSGPTTTTTTQQIPKWMEDWGRATAGRATDLLNKPYEQNPVPGVAPFTPYQFAGMDMIANNAMNNPLPGQAASALGNILGGQGKAPQSSNPYLGATTGTGSNAWEGKTTSVGSNPYAGANPYLEQNITRTLGDITRSYNQNVAPTMAAQAYKGGSVGNTGQAEMEATSRDMLQRNLGSTAANMRMQDYGMQQQLAESDIGRRMNAQLADYARSAGLAEGTLNRSMTAGLADAARNANLYESGADRALRAYQLDQGNMFNALGMAPQIYGMGFTGGNALSGIGAQQQNLAQQQLNVGRQDWNDYNSYDVNLYKNLAYGGNTGGTTTQTAPGGNPITGAIGGAGLFNMLFGGGKDPNYGGYGGGISPWGIPNWAIPQGGP